jgi:quercetin dioxygenase-like cupin family protein
MAYFDHSGEASDEAGRWANLSDLPALNLVPGIAFQPITTDSVMTNFVTFEPNSVADMHQHSEQQIAIVVSGELTFTVGGETRVTHAGDCVVIPHTCPMAATQAPKAARRSTCSHPPAPGSSTRWRSELVRVDDPSLSAQRRPRCSHGLRPARSRRVLVSRKDGMCRAVVPALEGPPQLRRA